MEQKDKKKIFIAGGLVSLVGIAGLFFNKNHNKYDSLFIGLLAAGTGTMIGIGSSLIKPSDEEKSNLVDEMLENMGKPQAQFTITNKSNSIKTIKLFDINSHNVQEVTITPSMRFFNNTLMNDPKKVKEIRINANGAYAQIQATQVITKICKDANGDESIESYNPIVATTQYQGGMTAIQPNNLILDGICHLEYQIQPNTTVTLIVDYQELKKSDLLK